MLHVHLAQDVVVADTRVTVRRALQCVISGLQQPEVAVMRTRVAPNVLETMGVRVGDAVILESLDELCKLDAGGTHALCATWDVSR